MIVDETGLMPERARELLAGLRSSVSAKGGRIMHISVRGDAALFAEILENPATVAHVYAAADGAEIGDRDAWAAANPGLGSIKQESYMIAECDRIQHAPGDEPSFRAFDLNQPLNPTREMILSPDDLRKCFTDDLPAAAADRPCWAWMLARRQARRPPPPSGRQPADANSGWRSATSRPWRTGRGGTARPMR